jgi:hypothetical protein
MKNITVRLLDIAAVNENKNILDLDVLFSGSMNACNKYCQMIAGYTFKRDVNNIHGGYYVNAENGDCLMLV